MLGHGGCSGGGCGCGSDVVRLWLVDQWVSCDVDIMYFLNSHTVTCPVSSVGRRVVIHRLKGPEFDSCWEHLFYKYDYILFN